MKQDTAPKQSKHDRSQEQWFTVPNVLCLIRLIGSIPLLMAALGDKPRLFLWLFVFLAVTDWLDGKLAILLDQKTVLGARLDSYADIALYSVLFFRKLHPALVSAHTGVMVGNTGDWHLWPFDSFWFD